MTGTQRRGYRGYVTPRGFGGLMIPVPVQSLVLRDYCTRKEIPYALHVNENIFPGSYMVLEGLVRALGAFSGVLMCSMHMLPRSSARRREIIERILDQDCTLHLVLESIVIAKPVDVDALEELIVLSELSSRQPNLAILN
jgi:sporadic carbohydrate cluster protein (TIGR04323 family)